ncbi:MAG: hypothetical protein AB7D02_01085, partial [Candidatus Paceibacterota bacterium]
RVQKSGANYNISKLEWYNNVYLKKLPFEEEKKRIFEYLKINNPGLLKNYSLDYLTQILKIELVRINKFSDIFEISKFFFQKELNYPKELLVWKDSSYEHILKSLEDAYQLLKEIPEGNFNAINLQEKIFNFIEQNTFYKNDRGKLLWPLRVALTGEKASPPPFEVAEILKKEETLKRIQRAINLIKGHE